jgi:hypothetical protein
MKVWDTTICRKLVCGQPGLMSVSLTDITGQEVMRTAAAHIEFSVSERHDEAVTSIGLRNT